VLKTRLTGVALAIVGGALIARVLAGGAALATSSVVAPPDQPVSLTVGPVVISTFNPVTITPFEKGTMLYFVAQNTGAAPITLQLASWNQLLSTKPTWMFHLFKFFGFREKPNEPPADSVVLQPGETRSLEVHASKDINGGPSQQADLAFRFVVVESGASGTLTITVRADDSQDVLRATSASIVGRITTPDGIAVAGVEVIAALLNDRGTVRAFTMPDGTYRLDVVSIDHVRTIMGPRRYPYRSIDYFVTATKDGYRLGYQPGVAPATGQTLALNLTLQPLIARPVYRLIGELPTEGLIAYWWTRFAGNNDRVVSVLGQHPPVASMPGHIVAVSLTGQELWRVVTGDQCWGLDVSADGSVVAAGCYDGYLYLVASSDGRLLHKVKTGAGGGWVQTVKFSPDGRHVVADGAGPPSFTEGFSVVAVATGAIAWSSTVTGANKAAWTADGDVVSARVGPLAKFSPAGVMRWRSQLGESPLWMETDAASNIYTSGKTNMLTSLDKDGRERWRYRVAATSNEGSRTMTSDGSFMLAPGFNGQLQALNSAGALLWQRFMPGLFPTLPPCDYGPGHNALSMVPDASLIAIGTKCYGVELYDRTGSLLWSHKASRRPDFKGQDPRVYGNYTGTQSVDITPDGRYIAAGYADSVIRIFKRAPTMATDRTALRFSATKAGASGALISMTPAQSVTASAADAPLEAWTASSNQPWLSITNGAATGSGLFTAAIVNPGNVIGAATSLTATITVTSPTAANSPLTIPVTLTIDQSGNSTVAAFGQVDTPAQNATGVVGAIGVTGWVVDDVGVANVKVYRTCLAFEHPALCQLVAGNNVVFVGDAVFVPGARPDVEAAFPTYPASHVAGWGFLLLTNMLPNVTAQLGYGGQGSLALYVVATDLEGHVTVLGRTQSDHASTTMTLANASIAKPFGSIDTPAQGGTVSGSAANFGWVLTPDSNTVADATDILMATNGSAITVFIDGAPVGMVTYNQCRGTVGNPIAAGVYCNDDVSNIFGNPTPQPTFTARTANATVFRNLDMGRSAIGAFAINTLSLTNGIHSIAWGVSDSAGRQEGIGSRNFFVLNSGADSPSRPAPGATEIQTDGSWLAEAVHADVRVTGRWGFALDTPLVEVRPDAAGERLVRIDPMGRVELQLGGDVSQGYLVANGTTRPLPAGSQLDATTGTFTWAPAPGFHGAYRLVFVAANARIVPVTVTVQPLPAPVAGDGEGEIRMHIDAATVDAGRAVRVEGWALDPQAFTGSGIGTAHVWARRIDVPTVSAEFLGEATRGVARPDVAAAFGAGFGQAGFLLNAPLAPGTYDITVYIWNLRTARWEDARTVRLSVSSQ